MRIVERQLITVIEWKILRIKDVTFVHEIWVLEDLLVIEGSLLIINVEEFTAGGLVELYLREFVWFKVRGNVLRILRDLEESTWIRSGLDPGLVLNVSLNVDNACSEIVFLVIVGHSYT